MRKTKSILLGAACLVLVVATCGLSIHIQLQGNPGGMVLGLLAALFGGLGAAYIVFRDVL